MLWITVSTIPQNIPNGLPLTIDLKTGQEATRLVGKPGIPAVCCCAKSPQRGDNVILLVISHANSCKSGVMTNETLVSPANPQLSKICSKKEFEKNQAPDSDETGWDYNDSRLDISLVDLGFF